LFSDFGTKVVEFLLKFAAYEESRFDRSIGTLKGPHPSFDADSLFQFDAGGKDGAYNNGTVIHLDPTLGTTEQAGALAHEAMEVYFRQADDVPGNTLPMDYIADYMAGQVEMDIGNATGNYGPYTTAYLDARGGKGYDFWTNDATGGKKYSTGGFLGLGGEGGDPGVGQKTDNDFLGNPMGLSLSMLTWENGPDGNGTPSNGKGLNGD
ncbi:MAG TPA: hypothetical protein VKT82_12720, partial [Ktedonobacterales bacterium]|nr:hypothetical protein [Ktedonobacterales bacterium]